MAQQKPKQKRPRPQAPAARPAQAAQPVDNLRAIAAGPRDIIPWEVLALVFAAVWFLVLFMMAPGFRYDFALYMARRNYAKQKPAAAVKHYKYTISQKPNDPTLLSELGQSYVDAGQYDEAIKYFQEAQNNADKMPVDDQGRKAPAPDFNPRIGGAYFLKGDYANAEKHFQLALQRDRLEPSSSFHMGQIELKRGHPQKAAEYFKIVARDPLYEKEVQKYYAQIEAQLFGQSES